MQDIQNIPNPDINSTVKNDDFGNHSEVIQDLDNDDIEQVENAEDVENIPNADPDVTAGEKETDQFNER